MTALFTLTRRRRPGRLGPTDAGLAILQSAVTAAVTAAMSMTAQDQPPPARQLHPPGAYAIADPYAAADDRPPRETQTERVAREWRENHQWADMEDADVRQESSASAAVEPPPQADDPQQRQQWSHWRSSAKHGPLWHARKIARAASHATLVNKYASAAVNQSRAMTAPIAALPICVRCQVDQPNIRCR